LFAVIATADLQGLRNRVGTLCLAERETVFFSRKWGRLEKSSDWIPARLIALAPSADTNS
jgi:hypothetical protein